jgi:hypothetical protein
MQEIARNVFIETEYPGVTLGAINWPQGLILIDVPFRPDDIRLWLTSLLNLTHGIERLLINLDDHYDRTLGSRQVECMVVGHEKMIQLFKDRPSTFKPQNIETGAEWELYNSLGTVRWAPPDITFSHHMAIHGEDSSLLLETHPGPSISAIWTVLPLEKVVFIGDAVVKDAPPFLANADIPAWLESLSILLTPKYRNYTIISGRNGVVSQNDVKTQAKNLEKIAKTIEKIGDRYLNEDEINKSAQHILRYYDLPKSREPLLLLRVKYGLVQYMRRRIGLPLDLAV